MEDMARSNASVIPAGILKQYPGLNPRHPNHSRKFARFHGSRQITALRLTAEYDPDLERFTFVCLAY